MQTSYVYYPRYDVESITHITVPNPASDGSPYNLEDLVEDSNASTPVNRYELLCEILVLILIYIENILLSSPWPIEEAPVPNGPDPR